MATKTQVTRVKGSSTTQPGTMPPSQRKRFGLNEYHCKVTPDPEPVRAETLRQRKLIRDMTRLVTTIRMMKNNRTGCATVTTLPASMKQAIRSLTTPMGRWEGKRGGTAADAAE
jgi:hypothetical protein